MGVSQRSSSPHTMDDDVHEAHFCINFTTQYGKKKFWFFFFLPNKIAKIWTVKKCMYLYILYLYIFSHQNRHQGKFKAELIVPTYYRLIMSPYLNVIRSMLPWPHHCCTDSFGLAGGSTCSCSRPDLVKASSQWPPFYRWCRPFTSSARCD